MDGLHPANVGSAPQQPATHNIAMDNLEALVWSAYHQLSATLPPRAKAPGDVRAWPPLRNGPDSKATLAGRKSQAHRVTDFMRACAAAHTYMVCNRCVWANERCFRHIERAKCGRLAEPLAP